MFRFCIECVQSFVNGTLVARGAKSSEIARTPPIPPLFLVEDQPVPVNLVQALSSDWPPGDAHEQSCLRRCAALSGPIETLSRRFPIAHATATFWTAISKHYDAYSISFGTTVKRAMARFMMACFVRFQAHVQC
jgi:hypothetical protein